MDGTVFGVLLVLAYGVGMAGTLTTVGYLVAKAPKRLGKIRRTCRSIRSPPRLAAVAPLITAVLVLIVGIGLAVRTAARCSEAAMSRWVPTAKRIDASIDDPEAFWREQVDLVDWFSKPTRVLDASRAPFYRWFPDGTLNTCYNALDRHVDHMGAATSPRSSTTAP